MHLIHELTSNYPPPTSTYIIPCSVHGSINGLAWSKRHASKHPQCLSAGVTRHRNRVPHRSFVELSQSRQKRRTKAEDEVRQRCDSVVASMDTSFKLSLCGEGNTNRLSMFRSKSPETCKSRIHFIIYTGLYQAVTWCFVVSNHGPGGSFKGRGCSWGTLRIPFGKIGEP